jgi:hypothetical protein
MIHSPDQPPRSIRVTVTAGPDRGLRCPLVERELLLIGRGDQCGLQLSDPSVSRVHCRLLLTEGRITLEDVGSRWGVLINGVAAQGTQLQIADRLGIGDSELRLEYDNASEETMAPRGQPTANSAPPQNGHAAEPARPAPPPVQAPASFASPSLTGSQFMRFRVGNLISQSATGTVYKAFDPRHERVVALKIYSQLSQSDETAQRRFIGSVRTMITLNHPNLVRLLTAGRWRKTCFAVTEFVEGETASDLVRRNGIAGMLDWRTAWQIAIGVAQGLEFAHSQQIIHRNLHPDHILLGRTPGSVRLGELTLAKALDDSQAALTRPGEIVGDFQYLAPEQLSGQPVDARADLYSLGATLYTILTGRPPFTGPITELLPRILNERPVPPTRYHLSIPAAVEGVILKLLAKRPEDRYDSATALLREMRRVRQHCS